RTTESGRSRLMEQPRITSPDQWRATTARPASVARSELILKGEGGRLHRLVGPAREFHANLWRASGLHPRGGWCRSGLLRLLIERSRVRIPLDGATRR